MWVVAGVAAALTAFLLISSEYRKYFLFGGGIAAGALIAAIALGVVLTYRGSGVVNFANGAIAMYIGYVYAGLRRDGHLFLPPLPNPLALVEGLVHAVGSDSFSLPDIPSRISFGSAMSFWPAFVISIVFCVVLGLLLHLLIFRPLRNAPPLAKVVASVGLLLYLQAVVIRRFNITPRPVKPLPFVKKTQVNLGLTKINQDQLFVTLLVIALTFALWFLFQKTRFGLATRAAAENEKGAVVLGFSPDFLAGTNWVLSTVIAGMVGIFVASINSTIEPIVLPALIVPALTAALVGSFSSFGRTTLAAFVLGMQVPLLQYLGTNKDWFPKSGGQPFPGVDRVLPFLLIVVVLYVAGNALPTRGAITSGRLPFSPTPPRWAIWYGGPALAILAALVGIFVFGPEYRGALADTLIGVIICLSVVVITGFVGQISLAQMAFAGISAFLVSKLSVRARLAVPVADLRRRVRRRGRRASRRAPRVAGPRREPRDRDVRVRGRDRRHVVQEQQCERRLQRCAGEGTRLGQPVSPREVSLPRVHVRRRETAKPDDRDLLPDRGSHPVLSRREHSPIDHRTPDACDAFERARRRRGRRQRFAARNCSRSASPRSSPESVAR